MKVVFVSVSPPVGPSSDSSRRKRSQAMAPGATKAGSVGQESPGDRSTLPQTVLVSRECCHVARIGPSPLRWLVLVSNGLGLKKWVMICLSSSLNRVASGVKSARRSLRVACAGGLRQADVVLGADGVTHEERLVPRWHLNVGRARVAV